VTVADSKRMKTAHALAELSAIVQPRELQAVVNAVKSGFEALAVTWATYAATCVVKLDHTCMTRVYDISYGYISRDNDVGHRGVQDLSP
jgi:hypothetical protein